MVRMTGIAYSYDNYAKHLIFFSLDAYLFVGVHTLPVIGQTMKYPLLNEISKLWKLYVAISTAKLSILFI